LGNLKFAIGIEEKRGANLKKLKMWLEADCVKNFGVPLEIIEASATIHCRKIYLAFAGYGELDKVHCVSLVEHVKRLKHLKFDSMYAIEDKTIEKSISSCDKIRYDVFLVLSGQGELWEVAEVE